MNSKSEINRIFKLQSDPINTTRLRTSSYKERVEKIKRLESFILNDSNHQIIADALYKDLRKPNEEVITTEITPTLLNIKHVLKNLKNWMKDEHVPSPITMVGMSSYIKYESKGTLLLISPWNYPIFLSHYQSDRNLAILSFTELPGLKNSTFANSLVGVIINDDIFLFF